MTRRLARALHALADRLDPSTLERLNVRVMNQYIGQTERYIIALEDALREPTVIVRLRALHGRFNTKPMRDAGAWN